MQQILVASNCSCNSLNQDMQHVANLQALVLLFTCIQWFCMQIHSIYNTMYVITLLSIKHCTAHLTVSLY